MLATPRRPLLLRLRAPIPRTTAGLNKCCFVPRARGQGGGFCPLSLFASVLLSCWPSPCSAALLNLQPASIFLLLLSFHHSGQRRGRWWGWRPFPLPRWWWQGGWGRWGREQGRWGGGKNSSGGGHSTPMTQDAASRIQSAEAQASGGTVQSGGFARAQAAAAHNDESEHARDLDDHRDDDDDDKLIMTNSYTDSSPCVRCVVHGVGCTV